MTFRMSCMWLIATSQPNDGFFSRNIPNAYILTNVEGWFSMKKRQCKGTFPIHWRDFQRIACISQVFWRFLRKGCAYDGLTLMLWSPQIDKNQRHVQPFTHVYQLKLIPPTGIVNHYIHVKVDSSNNLSILRH